MAGSPDTPPRMLRLVALPLISAGALLLAWHVLVVGLHIPPYLVPGPLAVLKAFWVNWKIISAQTGFTLTAAALGLFVSTIFAAAIAVSFSMSRSFAQASL